MSDTRRSNKDWTVCGEQAGDMIGWDGAKLAVLMDLRDELKKLNTLLHCSKFTSLPDTLRKIERNTRRKRKPTN